MIRRAGWVAACLFLCGTVLYAQNQAPDSLGHKPAEIPVSAIADSTSLNVIVEGDTIPKRRASRKPKFLPNPKTALRLSLLTPALGGGQIYNRDYWKLPLVYAGYGASIYFIVLNINRYGTMVDHYKEFYHLDDPSDPKYGQVNSDIRTVRVYIKSQDRYADMSMDQVQRVKDTYRRWRDWSFFALGAVYALAAIEANVAAHMKTFDLTDDLSMRIQPSVVQPHMPGPAPGLKLVLLVK